MCQQLERYKDEWNRERQEYETRFKLRNREDSFLARYVAKGIKVTPVLSSELIKGRADVEGSFDLVVIAGEITYQSFSIAPRVRTLFPEIPIFIEFCEATYDELARKLILRNSKSSGVAELISYLVYDKSGNLPHEHQKT